MVPRERNHLKKTLKISKKHLGQKRRKKKGGRRERGEVGGGG